MLPRLASALTCAHCLTEFPFYPHDADKRYISTAFNFNAKRAVNRPAGQFTALFILAYS